MIEFDPSKSERNERERGLPFSMAEQFEFETAIIQSDDRVDYGEARFRALGFMDGRLFSLVYTWRGEALRVISLRKANARENAHYQRTRSRNDRR